MTSSWILLNISFTKAGASVEIGILEWEQCLALGRAQWILVGLNKREHQDPKRLSDLFAFTQIINHDRPRIENCSWFPDWCSFDCEMWRCPTGHFHQHTFFFVPCLLFIPANGCRVFHLLHTHYSLHRALNMLLSSDIIV